VALLEHRQNVLVRHYNADEIRRERQIENARVGFEAGNFFMVRIDRKDLNLVLRLGDGIHQPPSVAAFL